MMAEPNRSKRFWANYRNKRTYSGSAYTFFKGSTFPTNEEMDVMDKHGMVYDIDPSIRSAIIELNENGLKTLGSCAGHSSDRKGFVNFEWKPTEHKIALAKAILKKHGLVNIRIGSTVKGVWWGLNFNAVGIQKKSDFRKNVLRAMNKRKG